MNHSGASKCRGTQVQQQVFVTEMYLLVRMPCRCCSSTFMQV